MKRVEEAEGRLPFPKPDGTIELLTIIEMRDRMLSLLGESTNPEEIQDLKRMLLQLTAKFYPDAMEGLFGVHIVETAQERPVGEDCFQYLVGHDTDIQAFHDALFESHVISTQPNPGAYALYLRNGIVPCHIGKVTEKGRVISKWGPDAGVYEHEPLMTPLSYGNVIFLIPK